jgi:hypothetical protein
MRLPKSQRIPWSIAQFKTGANTRSDIQTPKMSFVLLIYVSPGFGAVGVNYEFASGRARRRGMPLSRPFFNLVFCRLIAIGAAVARRPLLHHRTYGPYAAVREVTLTTLQQRRKIERFEVGVGKPDRKGQAHCQPYCWPTALAPPIPTAPPGDGAAFSTAATLPL